MKVVNSVSQFLMLLTLWGQETAKYCLFFIILTKSRSWYSFTDPVIVVDKMAKSNGNS